jgi:D-arginine dehydrogenase
MSRFDVAIIGAGIAGASLAALLAEHKSVLLLEAEEHPGYHSTGRSAAFWSEIYGGPLIQPLTTASRAFLENPPAVFSSRSFLTHRGALHLGTETDRSIAEAMLAEFDGSGVALDEVDGARLQSHLHGSRPQWVLGLLEPDCSDIDVGGLHNAYLRMAKRSGAKLVCHARVSKLQYGQGHWDILTDAGLFSATIVVNAAGAWADEIAVMAGIGPLGIQPFRRTIMQLRVDPPAPENLPLVIGLDGSFYFKPEVGGRIWLSPHDEIPSAACDTAPEEIDVAKALVRFEEVVDWRIVKLERKWAGLRSFAPDRLPVIGPSRENPAFFWLAGQGGFGIQTAPAVAELAAALLTHTPHNLKGVDEALYSPQRFG